MTIPQTLLAILFLMQPRGRLAFWSASSHSVFHPLTPPESFSSGLLSVLETVLVQMQDLGLGLVKIHDAHKGPPL